MIDELSPNLQSHLISSIHPALLLIHEKKLEGVEPNVCLKDAYDVFATALTNDGQNLTQSDLKEKIPAWVLRWAVRNHWLGLPWSLLEVGAVSESKSFVTFGDCQTSKEAKADILKRLASRIARWEAQVLEDAANGSVKPAEDAVSIITTDAPDRRAQTDAFIEQVFQTTGEHITRTHIWKVAVYKEASQFERWQQNKGRVTQRAHKKFTSILATNPEKFVGWLKQLKLLK